MKTLSKMFKIFRKGKEETQEFSSLKWVKTATTEVQKLLQVDLPILDLTLTLEHFFQHLLKLLDKPLTTMCMS